MIKCDFHIHSNASPDGRHSIERLTKRARKLGINLIAICDHNICTPVVSLNDVTVIPGTEISTLDGHILGLFLETPVDYKKLTLNGLPDGNAAIDEIHRCGGVAVLAHPFERTDVDVRRLKKLNVDLIEGINSRASMKIKGANNLAMIFAKDIKKPVVGGSDAHSISELGSTYTEVFMDNMTPEGIKNAICDGKCHPVSTRNCFFREKWMSQLVKAYRQHNIKRIILYSCAIILSPLFDFAKGLR